MIKHIIMKFISIGGVGGCPVPQALSKANVHQERFPYDWLLANQTFVINTFEHIVFQPKDALHENMKTHFFDFENPEFVENTKFYTKSKNAFSIHDIEECGGYNIDVAHYIIEKYMRRFLRLMEIMEQKESLMFVRRSNVEIERKEWDSFFTPFLIENAHKVGVFD